MWPNWRFLKVELYYVEGLNNFLKINKHLLSRLPVLFDISFSKETYEHKYQQANIGELCVKQFRRIAAGHHGNYDVAKNHHELDDLDRRQKRFHAARVSRKSFE